MPVQYERFVDDLVASGLFPNREAALNRAVELLGDEIQQNGDDVSGAVTAQEWCERFDQWADSHKTLPREADDSRESIYADRGE